MKVLMLVYRVLRKPLGNRTGNEALALSEAGHGVNAIKIDWSGTEPKHQDLDGVKIENVKFQGFGGIFYQIFRLPILYKKLAQALKNRKFDVIYCQYPLLLPLALYFGRLRKAKVIYDAYEMYSIDFSEFFPSFLSGLARKGFEFLENQFVKRVDCVLTVDSVGDALENRYRKFNRNVEVLYNVPDLRHEPSEQKIRELKRRYGNEKILVSVGGLMKRKGLMKAFEAVKIARENTNVKLLLIGRLKDSKEDALEYIRRNKLEDDVELIGWLPYEEMLSYLKAAEMGLALYQPTKRHKLYPSKGTGRKFFTYMQSSLPVIGPNFAEVGQIVRETECGVLVDVTDPKQIAEAIIYLLEHPEEAQAMGERGRKAVEERYNWRIEKEKLLKAFEDLERE